MISTTDNLCNPMVVDLIGLYPQLDPSSISNLVTISLEKYELMKKKDPTCIYVVEYSDKKVVYLGDSLIENDIPRRMYLLGTSERFGEYTLYLNQADGKYDKLIKICRYSDPQVAINELNRFNNAGSHNQLNLQLYNVIAGYITKDISLHDMLIGTISLFGYRGDTKLQGLIQTTTSYGANENMKDIPTVLKNVLLSFKVDRNHLFGFYADLYDLVVSYNYFQGKEFQKDPEELNLSKVIEKVLKVMTHTP